MNTQYEEHLHEMFENKVADFDDNKMMSMLQRVIAFLPNGGKLYKYRSIDDPSFTNTYNSLNEGYIWVPAACELNDDEDTVLFYDPVSEAEEFARYMYDHPDVFIKKIYEKRGLDTIFLEDKRQAVTFDEIMNCYDSETGELIESKAVKVLSKQGISVPDSMTQIKKLKEATKRWVEQNKDKIYEWSNKYLHFNEENRKKWHVFSMTEDYDSNTMWAYYANSNKGFCIEYDYRKALLESLESKRTLCSIYRVVYKEEPEPFSFMRIFDYVARGAEDQEEYKRIAFDFLTKMLTKKDGWKHEKEWRILLPNIDNKLYVNLVGGIIIDERAINTDNGKKLLELCEQKGWTVTVRTPNVIQTKHKYISYDEWKTRRKQDAKS